MDRTHEVCQRFGCDFPSRIEIMPEDPEVEPLVVTGQRRLVVTERFNEKDFGNNPTLPNHGGQTPLDPGGAVSRCTIPHERAEWDKDAAAAGALNAIKSAAVAEGEPLAARERTAVLYKTAVGGVARGYLGRGATASGGAPYDFTGINIKDVVGLVHNHPGGTVRPSPADWDVYDSLKGDILAAGGDPSYIIANDYAPGSPTPVVRMRVYDQRNRAGEAPGPEVNPNGEPCEQ